MYTVVKQLVSELCGFSYKHNSRINIILILVLHVFIKYRSLSELS